MVLFGSFYVAFSDEDDDDLVIRSRRMRWAGHVARMGRGEVRTGFGVET
jgi:hypothetical protein